jgi:hypothetical protein
MKPPPFVLVSSAIAAVFFPLPVQTGLTPQFYSVPCRKFLQGSSEQVSDEAGFPEGLDFGFWEMILLFQVLQSGCCAVSGTLLPGYGQECLRGDEVDEGEAGIEAVQVLGNVHTSCSNGGSNGYLEHNK